MSNRDGNVEHEAGGGSLPDSKTSDSTESSSKIEQSTETRIETSVTQDDGNVTTTTTVEITTNNAQQSGTCGDDLNWYLNGTDFVITGTGEMEDYKSTAGQPWGALAMN